MFTIIIYWQKHFFLSSLKLLNTESVIPLSLFKMFMGAVERQPSRVSLFGDVTSFPLGLLVGWSVNVL
jgi:hypothetical protein